MATTVALPRTSDGTLTIDELSLLLLTSPSHIKPEREGETVIVTTKDAYFWAVFFSELAGRDGEPQAFLKRARDFIAEYAGLIRLEYMTLGRGPKEEIVTMFNQMAIAYGLNGDALRQRADAAYMNLMQKGLIEDPFKKKVAAFLICLGGLFPQNITATTDEGGIKAAHYYSRAVNVDYERGQGKETHIDVDIKLVQIIREVYPKLMEIFDEIVGGDEAKGGQPPSQTPPPGQTPPPAKK